jgi:hypothetical protein
MNNGNEMTKEEPRVLTQEEVQEQFFHLLWTYIDYWATIGPEFRPSRNRLEGLAFSVLNMLDGTTNLPAFDVITNPNSVDKEYCRDKLKENWWPQREEGVTVHGNDMLHEKFYDFGRKHGYFNEPKEGAL